MRSLLRKLMFVDLPLKRKFTLFACGVLFWFLLLTGIGYITLSQLQRLSHDMHTKTVPLLQYTQNSLCRLQLLEGEILQASQNHNTAPPSRFANWRSRLSALRQETLKNAKQVPRLQPPQLYNIVAPVWGWQPLETFEISSDLKPLAGRLGEVIATLTLSQQNQVPVSQLVRRLQPMYETLRHMQQRINTHQERWTEALHKVLVWSQGALLISLGLASMLLLLFTYWITRALGRPIQAIIQRLHNLAIGEVEMVEEIPVLSKDEIGVLTTDFNRLMESFQHMTLFKNVIEEDATLQDVYGRLAEVFRNEIGLTEFTIYEVNQERQSMAMAYPLNRQEEELYCNPDILAQCDLCRAVKTGHRVDATGFPRICTQFVPHHAQQLHICVPLITGGRPGGVVQFVLTPSSAQQDDVMQLQNQVSQAEAYIKQSLSVIEAKRLIETLRENTLRDPMTGLFNRRFVQDQADHIIAGVLRRQKQIGLLMCDIDYFKQVNDHYGHDVGDTILKETATLLTEQVRQSDLVVRFGGEEFLVMLLDMDPGQAEAVADKIRQAMADKKFRTGSSNLQKTISIGVSEYPADTEGFWQAIKYADVALYKAKDGGRNQVLRFTEDMWTQDDF